MFSRHLPLNLPTLLILLAVLVHRVGAVDLSVDDFRPHLSSQAADTAHLDPNWGDTIRIATKSRLPTPIGPYLMSDAEITGNSILNGKSGGTPNLAAASKGRFRCAYVAWDDKNDPKATDNGIFSQPTHLVVRDVIISEGTVQRAVAQKIAGNEIRRHNTAINTPNNTRPPSYFNFMAEGNRYSAYWGNAYEQGDYIRTTTHVQSAGGGAPNTLGRYLFNSGPTDTVLAAGFGKLGATVIPGTGGNIAVMAYESKVSNPVRTLVRWDTLDAGTHSTVEFAHTLTPASYGQDYALAADSAGNVVIIWREGADNPATSNLWLTAYNAAHTVATPPVQLQAAVSLNDGTTPFHFYRSYAVANVNRGNFLVSYTKGGSAYFQTVAIDYPAKSQSFDTGQSIKLSATADPSNNYPGIAVNQNKVLFGWFTKASGVHTLRTVLMDRSGDGVDTSTRQATGLPEEFVSFDSVGPGWYPYHYFKAPSLALDSAGNIAAAYDDQFQAKMALVANYAVFHDTGVFTSKSLTAADFASTVPIVAADSIAWLSARTVSRTSDGSPSSLALRFAISADGSFTDPGSGFQVFPTGRKAPVEAFKYRITVNAVGPKFITQTKADSLVLRLNVKPRKPAIDSIRIGTAAKAGFNSSAAYSILKRLDSVHLVVSGIDVDDGPPMKFYLSLGGKVVDSALSAKTAAGSYRTRFSFLPSDTLPNPLPVSIRSKDSTDWASLPLDFRPAFINMAPAETVTVFRNRGRDSSGVYRPSGGLRDTLTPSPTQSIYLQVGDDSAKVNIRTGDINDDSLTLRLLRNGTAMLTQRVAVGTPLSASLAADTLPPLVDTVVAEASDPDTTVTYRFLIRPNRLPRVDSVVMASYKARDSTVQTGPFDRVVTAGDTGLVVPNGLPAVLRAWTSDPDNSFGDQVTLKWTAYSAKAGCASGNLSCYDTAAQAAGDSLRHTFVPIREYVLLRAIDSTGAFTERAVRMEYPMLDTAGTAALQGALKALRDSLDFILGSDRASDTLKAEFSSTGNVPLQIHSVSTRADDRKWLEIQLNWEAPGTPPRKDSLKLSGRTDTNAVTAGNPVIVASGAKVGITFRITSDSLRGDSVFTDTVVLRTNDLANPFIRIPIRMVFNDLPVLSIGSLGGAPGAPGGYNDGSLPKVLPVRSRLVFTFSETVRVPDPGRFIRVYSYLDSLKNPAGHKPLPGVYDYRRRALAKGLPALGKPAFGVGRADSLADSLVFIPAYDSPSDSFKVQPGPGAFIHGDILHIAVSNGVVDRAGNALDLRLNKRALAPGALDTIWRAQVDTGVFRVASITPAAGAKDWNPDQNIKVRFNRRLGLPPPRGADSLTVLDFEQQRGDSNQGFWIRSAARAHHRYDLHLVAVEDGDSTLVFRTRPKLASFDTVTVTLSGALTSSDGLTLDGNLDGFPSRFYSPGDAADSTDNLTWTFYTREQEFYVFPNPFRHSDPRHRDKGTVTFKNINSLPGFDPRKETVLRIHTVNGDLVFNSKTSGRSTQNAAWASMDWDLRNNAGNLAGTGVYIYTLMSGNTKVLRKGKVAIIR